MIKVYGKSLSFWEKVKLFIQLNTPDMPKRAKRVYRTRKYDGYTDYKRITK